MSWIEKVAHGLTALLLTLYFTGVLNLYPPQQEECSTSCALLFPTCMAFVLSSVRLIWKLTEHPGEELHRREARPAEIAPVAVPQNELPFIPEQRTI